MIHYLRNGSIKLPFNVALFDANGKLRSGESSTTRCEVYCLANGYRLDSGDNTFKEIPDFPDHPTTSLYYAPIIDLDLPEGGDPPPLPSPPFSNVYKHEFDVTNWPRGIYLASFIAAGNEYYQRDFSVGLMVERKLGYSAVYNGTQFTMSLWVEEDGIAQTDYISLDNCRLLNAAGVELANLGSKTNPVNGVFQISATVGLAHGTNFIFDCVAVCHGPEDTPDYRFPLRVGLVRP